MVVGTDCKANRTGSCITFKFKEVDKGQETADFNSKLLSSETQSQGSQQMFLQKSSHNGNAQPCPLLQLTDIGKHYMVKSTSHPKTKGGPSNIGEIEEGKFGIRRQYTECFCMRKQVYDNLIAIGRNLTSSE